MTNTCVTICYTVQGDGSRTTAQMAKACTPALTGKVGNDLKTAIGAEFYSHGPCPKDAGDLRIRITGNKPDGFDLCSPLLSKLGAHLAYATRLRVFLTIEGEPSGLVFKAGD